MAFTPFDSALKQRDPWVARFAGWWWVGRFCGDHEVGRWGWWWTIMALMWVIGLGICSCMKACGSRCPKLWAACAKMTVWGVTNATLSGSRPRLWLLCFCRKTVAAPRGDESARINNNSSSVSSSPLPAHSQDNVFMFNSKSAHTHAHTISESSVASSLPFPWIMFLRDLRVCYCSHLRLCAMESQMHLGLPPYPVFF